MAEHGPFAIRSTQANLARALLVDEPSWTDGLYLPAGAGVQQEQACKNGAEWATSSRESPASKVPVRCGRALRLQSSRVTGVLDRRLTDGCHPRLGCFTNPEPWRARCESPPPVPSSRSPRYAWRRPLAPTIPTTGRWPQIIEPEPSAEALRVSDPDITVMTRNMYVGADVDAVIAALVTPDPADDQAALVAAIGTLQETDFPARAAAMAREIERARPHVVGLQEVSKIDITLPPLGVDLHLDFLPTLLAELAARGLHYDVAARVTQHRGGAFPRREPGRRGRDPRGPQAGPDAGDHRAELHGATSGRSRRVCCSRADGCRRKIAIGNRAYTVASTHLESGDAAGLDQLRAAQATELAQASPAPGRPCSWATSTTCRARPCTRCWRVRG